MSNYIISSSDGHNLHFKTKEEIDAYEKDEFDLFLKHHKILKEKYGIWASNQDKYVKSIDDLNHFDSKTNINF